MTKPTLKWTKEQEKAALGLGKALILKAWTMLNYGPHWQELHRIYRKEIEAVSSSGDEVLFVAKAAVMNCVIPRRHTTPSPLSERR